MLNFAHLISLYLNMSRIDFERKVLNNGLTVIAHTDPETPMAVVNVLYKVGARDEKPHRTGLAHLFEHLMFSGSHHVSNFDMALQQAGGNNNAFTNNDLTNYYDILPAANLETALWLEADRMHTLALSDKAIQTQRSVVMEEFKENYLNQPYGDVWHLLRDMAFKTHPYRWPTIGYSLDHIEHTTEAELRSFYETYYQPGNAVLTVAGGKPVSELLGLAQRWFGDVPGKGLPGKQYPAEAQQTEPRRLEHQADVPVHAIYKVYHMPHRTDPGYYAADLLSDVLSSGTSARLQQRLVRQRSLFSSVNASISGSLDPGLFIVHGRLQEGVGLDEAEKALENELAKLTQEPVSAHELEKVKNKVASGFAYHTLNLMNRAYSLAYFEMLGDADGLNREKEQYLTLTATDLLEAARQMLVPENGSTLIYKAKGKAA